MENRYFISLKRWWETLQRIKKINSDYYWNDIELATETVGGRWANFPKCHGEKPPIKVIYQLIDFGKTFIPALEAINNWGHQIIMDERWKHMKELSWCSKWFCIVT